MFWNKDTGHWERFPPKTTFHTCGMKADYFMYTVHLYANPKNLTSFESYYGRLVDDTKDLKGNCVYKLPGEKMFGLAVNGGEYRGPILYCPFCGMKLEIDR